MSYSKPTDEGIDNGYDEDDDESDIVENVSISLMVLLVYVKAAKDEEENSNNYLKSRTYQDGLNSQTKTIK